MVIRSVIALLIVMGGVYAYVSSQKTVSVSPSHGEATSTNNTVVKVTAYQSPALKKEVSTTSTTDLATLTDVQWKQRLTPDQYVVLRQSGTETPFTSTLLHESRAGTFVTADCGEPVFRSEAKFDSGTGWPSFFKPIKGAIIEKTDTGLGIARTEVVSAVCRSHLGHVFEDAPQTPTGLRYCINGVALIFIPD